MAPVAVEELTIEVARELSDGELRDLAGGEDDNGQIARQVLEERDVSFADDGDDDDDDAGSGDEGGGDEAKAEVPQPDVDEIAVDGTAQLSMFNMGGKLPTSASITLTGGSVKLVRGQAFNKGDRVRFTVEAVVHDVGQKDTHDPKTGQVVSCEQRHKARITDLQLDSRA